MEDDVPTAIVWAGDPYLVTTGSAIDPVGNHSGEMPGGLVRPRLGPVSVVFQPVVPDLSGGLPLERLGTVDKVGAKEFGKRPGLLRWWQTIQ